MNDASPTTYPITTLRDIWELPTLAQMECCLREITTCMLQARAFNDEWDSVAKAKNANANVRFQWPVPLNWVDDGNGEIALRYRAQTGQVLLTVRTEKAE